MKIIVVLPAFNEAKVIGQVLTKLKKTLLGLPYKSQIVVIDDGSWDKTSAVAKKNGAVVLRHVLNRGLGGALGTGLTFAKNNKADILVTIDSDGQHDPEDIKKAILPIVENRADVVIGSRLLGQKGMPIDRILISKISNLVTFFLFGIFSSDSQSGFRVFNKKAIKNIFIKTEGMEVSSEFFGEIKKNKLQLVEVPIKVIYSKYSRVKGQTNLNGFKVLLKLIMRIFR